MKPFIGTKIILAEPMLKSVFDKNHSPVVVPPDAEDAAGYHVQYSNPDGSTYNSWSPANVFERAYREVSEDEKSLLTV